MYILSARNIHKRYGTIQALQDYTLEIPRGSTFGLLGPNGSGKTTLLGILLDIVHADQGSFQWHIDHTGLRNPRMKMGALLETPNFYPYLNASDNLRIVAGIKQADPGEIPRLLELVGLSQRAGSRFSAYSLGMKQRLAIAAALIGDPEVLIFDEPTNGLDPQGIAEVRELIRQIATGGRTVIMASHILDEVEKICSHVAIMHRGKLLRSGTVGSILSDRPVVEVTASDMGRLREILVLAPFTQGLEVQGSSLLITLQADTGGEEINRFCFERGIILQHLILRKRRLEEEFLQVIQQQA